MRRGDDKYLRIVVTHLGFKAVQNAKLRFTKNLHYAAMVQHQDLQKLFSVMCYVPGSSIGTHFVSLHCVLHVGYLSLTLRVFHFCLNREAKVKLLKI